MTIAHHPPEELLAAFAAGKLDEGEHLVVAVHASQCPACRRFIRAVETIGGAAIESAEPCAMSKGAFEALMAQIDQSPPKTQTPQPVDYDADEDGLPEILRHYRSADADALRRVSACVRSSCREMESHARSCSNRAPAPACLNTPIAGLS